MRMADILHRLGYIERNHVVAVTRDDLVGQYVGHTAPKTKEVLKRAYGGVLFIDEAYYLYRPENERDYGGRGDRDPAPGDGERARAAGGHPRRLQGPHGRVLPAQPGDVLARRAPHRLPRLHDRRAAGDRPVDAATRSPTSSAATPRSAFRAYLERRVRRPRFAHARSVRNAIERARLRHANRVYGEVKDGSCADRADLVRIEAQDILKSSVFEADPVS